MIADFFNRYDFWIRVVVLVLTLTVGVGFLIAGAQAAMAAGIVRLRPATTLTDNVIRLGDVFEGLSEKADHVLGPAPAPGQEMTLNARTLLRIALALDVSWQPETSMDQAILRRAASIVDEPAIRAALEKVLREKGMEGRFDVRYAGLSGGIALPPDQPATVEVASLSIDPAQDRFTAEIAAPSVASPLIKITLSGQVERIVSLPVLKTDLRNGDIINAHDLVWIEVPARDVSNDYLVREDDLAGMTPRRILAAGKPVKVNEVESPRMVERGGAVTIIFKNGAMTLTAPGRSLQDGAKGEVIRVVNAASARTIQGVVTNGGEITVQ